MMDFVGELLGEIGTTAARPFSYVKERVVNAGRASGVINRGVEEHSLRILDKIMEKGSVEVAGHPALDTEDVDFLIGLTEDRGVEKACELHRSDLKEILHEMRTSSNRDDHSKLGDIASRIARKEQGLTELEFGSDFESLQKALIKCDKNPGHRDFIPVTALSPEHLPEAYRDPDLLKHIRLHADLTVRLSNPDSSDQLNCHGSGWVRDVEKMEDTQLIRAPFPFPWWREVRRIQWWRIKITTAAHCVCNDGSARGTIVDFFYDTKRKPDYNGRYRLYGYEVYFMDSSEDWCTFFCATHDEGLANLLEGKCYEIAKLHRHLSWKFGKTELVVIVSHPHGLDKQVSIGRLVGSEHIPISRFAFADGIAGAAVGERYRYHYNAPTCPGSSGGPVWRLGVSKLHWCGRAHSRRGNGDNVSAVGFY